MPDCKCADDTWTVPGEICDDYISGTPDYHKGLCVFCWHDEACHKAKLETRIRADERKKVIEEIKEKLFK